MGKLLTPCLLVRAEVEQAYALVRSRLPAVALERWIRFARGRLHAPAGRPRGLMTIRNVASCIVGLFGFEVDDDLVSGRVLAVDTIVVATIPGRDAIHEAVLAAAERLAELHRCGAIRASFVGAATEADASQARLRGWFERSGYAVTALVALKLVAPDRTSLNA